MLGAGPASRERSSRRARQTVIHCQITTKVIEAGASAPVHPGGPWNSSRSAGDEISPDRTPCPTGAQ